MQGSHFGAMMAPFQLGIWAGPFAVGDIYWPLSSWGYGPAPFRLGIWTGPFPIRDMDQPLSGWGYGLAPSRLGIWTGPFPVFCSTLLNFVFAGRLGISPMDLGLMCPSLCGHRRRVLLSRRKMMAVFVANCVATVLVIYLSVALAT